MAWYTADVIKPPLGQENGGLERWTHLLRAMGTPVASNRCVCCLTRWAMREVAEQKEGVMAAIKPSDETFGRVETQNLYNIYI